jgi:uncharacterized membrane protein
MLETKKRTIAKTITYKILAITVGFITALYFTGSKEMALVVTIANSITTLIGFYLHERVWSRITYALLNDKDSHRRTLTKTITYKIWIFTVGTLTKWAIIGNFATALSIGITKNLITAVVYYIHDRVWNRFEWGTRPIQSL